MSNPLYQLLGNQIPQLTGSFGNMQNLINQFNQFKQTFRGDPRQQVQQLLSSGRVTQDQYNQAVQVARMLQNSLGGKQLYTFKCAQERSI